MAYTFGPWRAARDAPGPALEELRQRVGGAIGWSATKLMYEAGAVRSPRLDALLLFNRAMRKRSNDYQAAVADYEEALKLDPGFFGARVNLMDTLLDNKKFQEAAKELALAEAQSGACTDVERQLLRTFWADLEGRPWEALKAFENIAATQPDSWWLRFNKGQYEIYVNRPVAAARDLSQHKLEDFRSWGGTEWWGSLFLGTALHMAGDYRGELRAAKRAAYTYPDVLSARLEEASALIGLGRLAGVAGVIREASVVAPRPNSLTLNHLRVLVALELRTHGHPQESSLLAAQVLPDLQALPPEPRQAARFDTALMLVCLGREAEALATFRSLSLEVPGEVDDLGWTGALLARLGHTGEARKEEAGLAALTQPYLFGEHTYWRACIASQLGEKDRAVSLLGQAFGQGRRYWVDIHRNPFLEPLHGYPLYEELMKPKD